MRAVFDVRREEGKGAVGSRKCWIHAYGGLGGYAPPTRSPGAQPEASQTTFTLASVSRSY